MSDEPSEQARNILAQMGELLMFLQVTEQFMAAVLTFVLRGEGELTVESIDKARGKLNKATLGRLIDLIRRRADLDPGFESTVELFLVDRNIFIHDLERMGGFRDTPAGLSNLQTFIENLSNRARIISDVLMSVMANWVDETGNANDGDGIAQIRNLLGDQLHIGRAAVFPKAQ